MAKESLRRAIKAGVKIVLGTDAGVLPHGTNGREVEAMVDWGMTPADALRAETVGSAELLGVSERGVIEVVKVADLIAVEGNPLEDPTAVQRVRWVMKGELSGFVDLSALVGAPTNRGSPTGQSLRKKCSVSA